MARKCEKILHLTTFAIQLVQKCGEDIYEDPSVEKKLYIPALSIIAAVAILLGLTWYSTYRNLNRAEKRAMENAYRQGTMLLGAIESGARAGMHSSVWGEDVVRRLFFETESSM